MHNDKDLTRRDFGRGLAAVIAAGVAPSVIGGGMMRNVGARLAAFNENGEDKVKTITYDGSGGQITQCIQFKNWLTQKLATDKVAIFAKNLVNPTQDAQIYGGIVALYHNPYTNLQVWRWRNNAFNSAEWMNGYDGKVSVGDEFFVVDVPSGSLL